MKKIIFFVLISLGINATHAQSINGAWKRDLDTAVQYITIIDDYFSTATFDVTHKKFISTRGGTAQLLIGIPSGQQYNVGGNRVQYFQQSRSEINLLLWDCNQREKIDSSC